MDQATKPTYAGGQEIVQGDVVNVSCRGVVKRPAGAEEGTVIVGVGEGDAQVDVELPVTQVSFASSAEPVASASSAGADTQP